MGNNDFLGKIRELSFLYFVWNIIVSTTCSLKWLNELHHEILSQLIIFFHFGNHFVSNHLFVSLSNYLFSACRKFYWFYSAIHSVSSPKKSFEVNTSNNWLKYLKTARYLQSDWKSELLPSHLVVHHSGVLQNWPLQ